MQQKYREGREQQRPPHHQTWGAFGLRASDVQYSTRCFPDCSRLPVTHLFPVPVPPLLQVLVRGIARTRCGVARRGAVASASPASPAPLRRRHGRGRRWGEGAALDLSLEHLTEDLHAMRQTKTSAHTIRSRKICMPCHAPMQYRSVHKVVSQPIR